MSGADRAEFDFSLLVPSRGRPRILKRFLESIVANAARPERVEVVIGIDKGDKATARVAVPGLAIRRVIVPPKSTVGELNRACFEKSSGRFVMLANDDIVLHTKDWDDRVREVAACHADDIVLVHVNDWLFRSRLCTFPIVSRRACLATGVCPPDFLRYRIDDHLYDTYLLLARLGWPRIYYLPEVVFEHRHFTSKSVARRHANVFTSPDGRTYHPDRAIVEQDDATYRQFLCQRKEDAARLAELIEPTASVHAAALKRRLASVADSKSLRLCGYPIRVAPNHARRPTAADVTIAAIFRGAPGDDLSRWFRELRRSAEPKAWRKFVAEPSAPGSKALALNRAIVSAKTDVVICVLEGTRLSEGWLDGILATFDEKTAAAMPIARDRRNHASTLPVIAIDRRKCGFVRFDHSLDNPLMDVDYCLRIREQDYQVVGVQPPSVIAAKDLVVHIECACEAATRGWNRFKETWIDNGRLAKLLKRSAAT